jgi:uncharacterized protein
MFDSPRMLLLGLTTGFVFGFLLQKGRVAKFEVIVGQFLLRDWTVLKVMLTAVVVGSVGVYAMAEAGVVALHVKPALLGGVLLGGVLFGVGMALLGYCPGTSVAACGEGRRDAMVGVVGMLLGAGVYVAAYRVLEPIIHALGDWGKVTLPAATGTSPWFWIAALVIASAAAFALIESRGSRARHPRDFPVLVVHLRADDGRRV